MVKFSPIILFLDEFFSEQSAELYDLEDLHSQLIIHLNDELVNFKSYREKVILDIFKRFFTERLKYDNEIYSVFDLTGGFNISSFKLESVVFKSNSDDDHLSSHNEWKPCLCNCALYDIEKDYNLLKGPTRSKILYIINE